MALLKRLLTVLVAVLLIAVPASLAQGVPGGGGPPEGKGGGPPADAPRPDVGGGKPDGAGTKKGDIYADLWVIARFDDGTPLVDSEGCVRPITFASVVPDEAVDQYLTGLTAFTDTNAYDYGELAYLVPLVHDEDSTAEEPCDVAPDFAASFEYQGEFYPYVSETELGRLNLGRSPEKVVDKQLADVIATLTADGATVGLDPSGRLQALTTIDSPLQNMAAFQAILERGVIELLDKDGNVISSVDTSGLALSKFQQAATALAAATPKEEEFHVYVDTVQYLSRILNIPGDAADSSEVKPLLTDARGEEFLNFANFPAYTREDVFKGCVAYEEGGGEMLANIEGLFGTASAVNLTGIQAFTQLTADSRDVLVWLHDHPESVTAASSVGSDEILLEGDTGLTPCSEVVP